jgi:hypothetical protein
MFEQLSSARCASPADTLAALGFGKTGERTLDEKALASVGSSPDKSALTFEQRRLETLQFGLATNQDFERSL